MGSLHALKFYTCALASSPAPVARSPLAADPIALSLCACAKCGSTTVYLALIEAVFGGPLRVKAAMEAMDARAGRERGEPRNPNFLHFHWLVSGLGATRMLAVCSAWVCPWAERCPPPAP